MHITGNRHDPYEFAVGDARFECDGTHHMPLPEFVEDPKPVSPPRHNPDGLNHV
jgi:hypothetical protein